MARRRVAASNLAFLRRNVTILVVWPAIALCLGGLVWAETLSRLKEDKRHVRAAALQQAALLADNYAQQLKRALEQIDFISADVKFDWETLNALDGLHKRARAGLFPISGKLFVTIVGPDGKRLTSTLPGKFTGSSVVDKDYFEIHKKEAAAGLFTGPPETGERSGKRLVRFSRRLDARDGSFNGVVMVSIEPSFLASFIDGTTLKQSTFHAVRRDDGVLLLGQSGTGIASEVGGFRSPPTFATERGVIEMPGERFHHGEARFIAWSKIEKYRVVAIVGLSEPDVFARHHALTRESYQMATVASLLLAVLAGLGACFSLRLAWKKQQAEEVKTAYRVATDGAKEGFYMVRPLYDKQNAVVDFIVEDCNECGAAFYGVTRAELVGKTFSDFASAAYARHVIALFRETMETGSHEDEIRVPPDSPLRFTWLERRIQCAGNGLAVTLRDISAAKAHEERLSQLANADPLTALPNRHWLMNYLSLAVTRARNEGLMLGLLFVDLDDFKNINDTLGHAAGDELLRAVGKRLRGAVRPTDNVVRLGGDEFTIIVEHVQGVDDIALVAERIIKAMREAFVVLDGIHHSVNASMGISVFPDDSENGEGLLKHADIAMYAAKGNGKGRYQFYERRFSERLVSRLEQEQALRQAIEHDEFVLYYQPRVSAAQGELRSMEALVRWRHPERGLVLPSQFIALAEDTGLIVKLGELVIKKACAQIAQWGGQNLPVVPVSVNVSPRQLNAGGVSELFASYIREHQIDASLIEIEITESSVIGESPIVSAELAAIEALGVRILVDDFGTGYSSLSQLQRLDVDGLKVDQAFTAQITEGKEGEALITAILSMAHVLGLSVVAEGVETLEQLRALQERACDEIQGFLISKPLPAQEIPPLLRRRFLFPDSVTAPETSLII